MQKRPNAECGKTPTEGNEGNEADWGTLQMRSAECGLGEKPTEANEGNEGDHGNGGFGPSMARMNAGRDSVGETPTGATETVALPQAFAD